VGPGALACLESHRKAWQALVESGDKMAMVIEDDLIMSPDFSQFIDNDWWLDGADIIRLETYPSLSTKFDLKGERTIGNRRIHRLRSSTFGSGAYVISSRAAETLLQETETLKDHIDALLFHQKSPMFTRLKLFQIIPAPAIQAMELPEDQRPDWAKSTLSNERNELSSSVGGGALSNSYKGWTQRLLPWAWKAKALLKGMRHQRVGFR
jgi:glycosyl transferase family 25